MQFVSADPVEAAKFNIDASKLKWRDYCRNFGFGIKQYILNE
jgi:hypothetical protein